MDGLEVLDFGRDALWTTVWMCAPAMIAGLVVGLVIAFFQALTQIQEMTLVFVPKIIAIFAALLMLGVSAAMHAVLEHAFGPPPRRRRRSP